MTRLTVGHAAVIAEIAPGEVVSQLGSVDDGGAVGKVISGKRRFDGATYRPIGVVSTCEDSLLLCNFDGRSPVFLLCTCRSISISPSLSPFLSLCPSLRLSSLSTSIGA